MFELNLKVSWDYNGRRGKETLFHEAIGDLLNGQRDWSPAFRTMRDEVLEPGVQEQFGTSGHGTWAALAPSTVARKGNSMILIETGEMLGSFRTGGSGNVNEIGEQHFRWGSSLMRALFHQTGTGSGFQRLAKGSGRGMPMRKILQLDDDQRRRMRSIMVQRMATIARRVGFGVSKGLDLDPLSARMVGKAMLGI